ncbi:conserved hypothetical protein [Altererythrobacter sp. B11]|uniref:hypothetical protein n=1 Tax=Altererythrobacter sp. B11 TaxID=2060312 RepID=UPI000DC7258C|nr:hypothetical protein [Altererythrobacter sp. B11]BBC72759.1 conserved hypothetical protein [Altererythrobacter sp. B11]
MSGIKQRLAEDKALRDAARELFLTDIQFVRGDARARGIGGRLADRLTEGSADMAEEAADFATAHRSAIVGAAAAAALFLARRPIIEVMDRWMAEDHTA